MAVRRRQHAQASPVNLGVFSYRRHVITLRDEVRHDLAEARSEMRAELAKTRAELETGNLEIGNSFHFGKDGKHQHADKNLPKAEITPRGDFLIAGKQAGPFRLCVRRISAY